MRLCVSSPAAARCSGRPAAAIRSAKPAADAACGGPRRLAFSLAQIDRKLRGLYNVSRVSGRGIYIFIAYRRAVSQNEEQGKGEKDAQI